MKSNYIYRKNYDASYIASSNKMGGKQRGGYIYVEGSFDQRVFRKSSQKFGKFFRAVGPKKEVILKVKNSQTDCKGIVDMDYDFEGDEISFSDKIVDTNNACCLFGYLMKNKTNKDIIFFCKQIIHKVVNENEKKIEILKQLDEEKEFFLDFIFNLTIINLFKGENNDSTGKDIELNWILLTSDMDEGLKKLLQRHNFQKFKEYRGEKIVDQGKKNHIGINDHALENAIKCLIESCGDVNYQEKKISGEIHKLILKNIDTQNVNLIVEKLA